MSGIKYICANCKTVYDKPKEYRTGDGFPYGGCPKCGYTGADVLKPPDKAELKQYLALKREAERTREKLARLRLAGKRDAELEELAANTELRCRAKLIGIERFIYDIDDSLLRQVFELRYVSGLSWAGVAAGVGGYYSEDYLRIMHERYLKKIRRENRA